MSPGLWQRLGGRAPAPHVSSPFIPNRPRHCPGFHATCDRQTPRFSSRNNPQVSKERARKRTTSRQVGELATATHSVHGHSDPRTWQNPRGRLERKSDNQGQQHRTVGMRHCRDRCGRETSQRPGSREEEVPATAFTPVEGTELLCSAQGCIFKYLRLRGHMFLFSGDVWSGRLTA